LPPAGSLDCRPAKRFLIELGSGQTDAERLKRGERALRERVMAFRVSDRLSRDDFHRRDA
jgi:hypothetical protein